ncbi:helix-turn-helix domain-containing protein [Arthrobacter sp. UYCu712]|uniref:helix-turn-helix domain-containing protein n=1 Tax=Arthrobacter sp. UYCu712 TaxID=3156340 RepID=UPI0033995503
MNIDEEASFWAAFDRGESLEEAATAAGVSRSTAYRWMHRRFDQLRQSKVTVRRCQDQLRLTDRLSLNFERDRLSRLSKERNAATAAQHAASPPPVVIQTRCSVRCSQRRSSTVLRGPRSIGS